MNTNEYIKKYLIEEYNLNLNMDLERDIIIYECYIRSLKLFRHNEVISIFNSLIEEDIIYNSLFTEEFPRHRIIKFINCLLNENFIEQTKPTNEVIHNVKTYLGSFNVNKISYFKLTKQGKDFINTKKIRGLLKWD